MGANEDGNLGFSERLEGFCCSGNGNSRPAKKAKIDDGEIDGEVGLICREFAHHETGVARINNGSFGSCPASVLCIQEKWRNLFLQQPDSFYFGSLSKGILQSRKIVASLVNAENVEELALVDNATTAVAAVLQQVAWAFHEGKFKKGEAVLMLKYAYGAVKKAIKGYAVRAGAHVIEVDLPFPVQSKDDIIQAFCKSLEENRIQSRPIRLAVLDHVSSMPSIVLPLKELIGICRKEGIDQVFVDGAHTIGNLDIDMQAIGADFYTSNLHKWFFCPPSVAFLYCKKSVLPDMHHPVVSSEYGNGFALESAWIGNRDYSAQLSVSAAVDFVNQFEGGIDGIRKRNHAMALRMAEMLAKSWKTELGAPSDMCSSMVMVGLPDSLNVKSDEDAMNLRNRLRKEFGVEVPIYYRPSPTTSIDDEPQKKVAFSAYARISYQMYNTLDDYTRFRDAVNELVLQASQVH